MKEQDFEERMTNQPGATWKVFAMVRLLTVRFSRVAERSAATPAAIRYYDCASGEYFICVADPKSSSHFK